ncbi:MAG: hypothetical protein NWF02_01255 [Candidatus Bathyarchaeota archaeon]|nr:hypothetical protein [Candidatus Bathyarchaeum sp.]
MTTQNDNPLSSEELDTPKNEPNPFTNGNLPTNFTIPEGGFNFTRPEGDFNFTLPEDESNFRHPDYGFTSYFPFIESLTDEQTAILNETMQDLKDSGATQEEIMVAIQELIEEWGVQSP